MHDFPAFKRSVIRYWEKRRLLYNAALVLPTILGYAIGTGIDGLDTNISVTLPALLLGILGANICYSFAYTLEFFYGSDDPTSTWVLSGRTSALIGGILFAMFLAFLGGINLAQLEWIEHVRKLRHAQ